VKHDIWNYDTPTAPVLMDVTVNGRRIPGVFQATKQSLLYSFNRVTGEPIWPIEQRPVPPSKVPGEKLSPTQPVPTRPAPYEFLGRDESHLIDYTPEIRRLALEQATTLRMFAPFFNPPTHQGNPDGDGPALMCPGQSGGVNITGPPAADPVAGVIFVTSKSDCTLVDVVPGIERDSPRQTGKTVSRWARGTATDAAAEYRRQMARANTDNPLAGIPSLFKGPLGRITAIDLNTGEHLWVIPHGEMAQEEQAAFRNNPLLEGVDVDTNLGRTGHAAMMATPTLLFATGSTADNRAHLFAIDKKTGRRVGQVATPLMGQYGLMTYMHQGKQYVILPVNGGYTALALP
jgi:quinoprotein glucose dehydrogenase